MDRYTRVDGQVLDLTQLSDVERTFFRRCHEAYLANMPWAVFTNLAERSENPLIAATGGWITPQVREHPLYRAVRDLEDRLGIRQGKLVPDAGDGIASEPIGGTRIPANQALRH
jgi:hypothetical protein